MGTVDYNKAVRDRIPEIIRGSGRSLDVRRLDDGEFLEELEKKLIEEANEYLESGSVEELADLMEVIRRISELRGTSTERLEEIRKEKAEKRGGFEKNLFLVSAEEK